MNVRKPVIWLWLYAIAVLWVGLQSFSSKTSASSTVVEEQKYQLRVGDAGQRKRNGTATQAEKLPINDDDMRQNRPAVVAMGEREGPGDLDAILEDKLGTMSARISSLEERLSQLEASSRGAQHVVDSNNTLYKWNGTSSHTTTPGPNWFCASDLEKLQSARDKWKQRTQDDSTASTSVDQLYCALWLSLSALALRHKRSGNPRYPSLSFLSKARTYAHTCLLGAVGSPYDLFQSARSAYSHTTTMQSLEDAGPQLSEIYDIGFNRVPVLAKSVY